MDASVMMQAKQTEVFARLRNIVVTDANSQSLHRKVTFDLCQPLTLHFSL